LLLLIILLALIALAALFFTLGPRRAADQRRRDSRTDADTLDVAGNLSYGMRNTLPMHDRSFDKPRDY
jgi:hypothetical protein